LAGLIRDPDNGSWDVVTCCRYRFGTKAKSKLFFFDLRSIDNQKVDQKLSFSIRSQTDKRASLGVELHKAARPAIGGLLDLR
jgi:hypothetical protein